ncbi:hypothetical protein GCM10009624_10610 [Gordonia sinesedis]
MPANNLFARELADNPPPERDTYVDHDPEAAAEGDGFAASTIPHLEDAYSRSADQVVWINVQDSATRATLNDRGLAIPRNKLGRRVIDIDADTDVMNHPRVPWTKLARHGREVHLVIWPTELIGGEIRPKFPELDQVRAILPEVTVHLANHAEALGGRWRDFHTGDPLFTCRTAYEAEVRKAMGSTLVRKEAARRLASESGAPTPRLRSVGDTAMTPTRAIVPGVITTDSGIEVIGPSGTGKTGVVLDLGLSTATGTPWAGMSVTRGRVVYMVGEGGGDAFDARVDAWLAWHQMTRDDIAGWFAVVDPSATIGSPQWETLAADIAAFRPVLVIIDTRTAHLPPGTDDNATSVATAMLGALKDLRRRCGGASTLLVHHPGKQGKAGRGSQAPSDAADTRLLADRKGDRITLTEDKQRHFAGGGRWTFTTEEVAVDHPVFSTAAVVVHEAAARDADETAKAEDRAAERKAKADNAADAKRDAARTTLLDIVATSNAAGKLPSGTELVDAAVKAGISRDLARKVRKSMVDDGTFTTTPGPRSSDLHEVAK